MADHTFTNFQALSALTNRYQHILEINYALCSDDTVRHVPPSGLIAELLDDAVGNKQAVYSKKEIAWKITPYGQASLELHLAHKEYYENKLLYVKKEYQHQIKGSLTKDDLAKFFQLYRKSAHRYAKAKRAIKKEKGKL